MNRRKEGGGANLSDCRFDGGTKRENSVIRAHEGKKKKKRSVGFYSSAARRKRRGGKEGRHEIVDRLITSLIKQARDPGDPEMKGGHNFQSAQQFVSSEGEGKKDPSNAVPPAFARGEGGGPAT